jgi:hypothetical protein
MSLIRVVLEVRVPDGVERDAAESMFDLACQSADEELVESVDGYYWEEVK